MTRDEELDKFSGDERSMQAKRELHTDEPRGNDPRIHSGYCPAAEGRECTCGMGFKPMPQTSEPAPRLGRQAYCRRVGRHE